MRIPTDDIDRSSGTLWELSRNLERLSNRARDLAGQIASCYDGGGVGRRPANAADKAYRDARQAKNRAEILHRAVNIYTGREDELLNQAHAAAGTIKAGVNPQWTGKSWISDILLRQFTAVLPNHPGTTCQGMGRVFTFAALSSVLGAAAVVPYSILRRRSEKFGDIIKTAAVSTETPKHTGTDHPSNTDRLIEAAKKAAEGNDREAEDLAEEMKKDRNRAAVSEECGTLHDYKPDNVQRGHIRRVDQSGGHSGLANNGWGRYGSIASGQCNTACESMALSYVGVNKSPESLVSSYGDTIGGIEVAKYGTGQHDWKADDGSGCTIHIENNYVGGGAADVNDIRERTENFVNDMNEGNTAPVMVHYVRPSDNSMHWVMLTGINEDGSYHAIGPWGNELNGDTQVWIDKNGNMTVKQGALSHGGGHIDKYAQYTRVDG